MIYDCVGRQIMVNDIIVVAMTTYNDPYFNVYRVIAITEPEKPGEYVPIKIKCKPLKSGNQIMDDDCRASTLQRSARGITKTMMVINESILQQMLQQN